MSDISVGSLGASPDTSFQSSALQNLDKDAFLQLLVAQMQYQNPLSPVDSNEYLAQAAQYASVEQLENMAESQAELKSMQMVSIATDLVGKEVTAINPLTGGMLSGTVGGIRFGAEPVLIVDGIEVGLSSVLSVGDVPEITGPGDNSGNSDGTEPQPDGQADLAPPLTDGEQTPTPEGQGEAALDPPLSVATTLR